MAPSAIAMHLFFKDVKHIFLSTQRFHMKRVWENIECNLLQEVGL